MERNLDFPVEKEDFVDMREIFPGIFAFRWRLNGRRCTKFFTDVFPEELAKAADVFFQGSVGITEVTFDDVYGFVRPPG